MSDEWTKGKYGEYRDPDGKTYKKTWDGRLVDDTGRTKGRVNNTWGGGEEVEVERSPWWPWK